MEESLPSENRNEDFTDDICLSFREGDFKQASKLQERALYNDPLNEDILAGVRYRLFLEYRQDRMEELADSYQRGCYLQRLWEYFIEHVIDFSRPVFTDGIQSVRFYLFHKALKCFDAVLQKREESADLLWRKGCCYRGIGLWRHAVGQLRLAHKEESGSAVYLADLADSLVMAGDERKGKLYFWDAFCLDPEEINLLTLDTPFIADLFHTAVDEGHNRRCAKYWIPVYGRLKGVFNIVRELSPREQADLSQMVYNLKSELKEGGDSLLLIPRLLVCYFRIIDDMYHKKRQKAEILRILPEIKWLDEKVYNDYMQHVYAP